MFNPISFFQPMKPMSKNYTHKLNNKSRRQNKTKKGGMLKGARYFKKSEEELLHNDFIDTLNSEQKEKLIIYFKTLIEGLQRKINTDKPTNDIELIYNERKLFYTKMIQYAEMHPLIYKPYGKRIFSLINKLNIHQINEIKTKIDRMITEFTNKTKIEFNTPETNTLKLLCLDKIIRLETDMNEQLNTKAENIVKNIMSMLDDSSIDNQSEILSDMTNMAKISNEYNGTIGHMATQSLSKILNKAIKEMRISYGMDTCISKEKCENDIKHLIHKLERSYSDLIDLFITGNRTKMYIKRSNRNKNNTIEHELLILKDIIYNERKMYTIIKTQPNVLPSTNRPFFENNFTS
jgi:hypothetical protein